MKVAMAKGIVHDFPELAAETLAEGVSPWVSFKKYFLTSSNTCLLL
jgi:hypothetical protein